MPAGVFQTGFDSQDYGTAQNLFTNGQAAMFYMGSWETSMALNEDIPEEVRDNIRAFVMPAVADGKGTATDLAAWNGGGYAVSADSKVKDEAIKFLNYMYQPDQLSSVALLIAAMSAEGRSTIQNIDQIDRGYCNIDGRLNALGARITRCEECG